MTNFNELLNGMKTANAQEIAEFRNEISKREKYMQVMEAKISNFKLQFSKICEALKSIEFQVNDFKLEMPYYNKHYAYDNENATMAFSLKCSMIGRRKPWNSSYKTQTERKNKREQILNWTKKVLDKGYKISIYDGGLDKAESVSITLYF